MTNREYIETLSNEKIADFLSESIQDCNVCPINDYCHNDDFTFVCYRVWLRWLEDEHKEVEE